MKRIIALALLALCFIGAAAGEEYVNSFKDIRVFSVSYDPDVFELDDKEYKTDNTDSYEWCFMLISDDYSINCEMEYVPGYERFSLFSASDDEKLAYADVLCAANAEYNSEYVETYEITVRNGNKSAVLPFIILHMNDDHYGETYYAETVANGCAIYFEIYDYNPKRPNAGKKQILLSLLDTFVPIP